MYLISILKYLLSFIFKPRTVSVLKLSLYPNKIDSFYYNKEKQMKIAKVKASWITSISADVVSQNVVVVDETNGVELVNAELSAEATETIFEVPEKTSVTISVSCSDGTFTSDSVSLTFSVADLTAPLPPAGLVAEIIEVFEDGTPEG
jgi:hypothetical protein